LCDFYERNIFVTRLYDLPFWKKKVGRKEGRKEGRKKGRKRGKKEVRKAGRKARA
jgi:predicted transposase YdaD